MLGDDTMGVVKIALARISSGD